MIAIITVKLERNPKHNPLDKKGGDCPLTGRYCSDIIGQHHSYIEEGVNLNEIREKASQKYKHITRIEVVDLK